MALERDEKFEEYQYDGGTDFRSTSSLEDPTRCDPVREQKILYWFKWMTYMAINLPQKEEFHEKIIELAH